MSSYSQMLDTVGRSKSKPAAPHCVTSIFGHCTVHCPLVVAWTSHQFIYPISFLQLSFLGYPPFPFIQISPFHYKPNVNHNNTRDTRLITSSLAPRPSSTAEEVGVDCVPSHTPAHARQEEIQVQGEVEAGHGYRIRIGLLAAK